MKIGESSLKLNFWGSFNSTKKQNRKEVFRSLFLCWIVHFVSSIKAIKYIMRTWFFKQRKFFKLGSWKWHQRNHNNKVNDGFWLHLMWLHLMVFVYGFDILRVWFSNYELHANKTRNKLEFQITRPAKIFLRSIWTFINYSSPLS